MTVHYADGSGFGRTLQKHRSARRMSQLDLANLCEISARHLSFLESGRAHPSRDMVERLGAGLVLPLGARNALLLAAGFAPTFPTSPLQSEALGPFRKILDEMIARHAPNPALLVDRHWNVCETNATARALLSPLQDGDGQVNVARWLADTEHASKVVANLSEVLIEMTLRLQLEALEAGDDPVLADLLRDLERASERYPERDMGKRRPVLPLELIVSDARWRFLSVIAHFGTSEDVTVRDLRLELLFPADTETRVAVRGLADQLAE